MPDRCFKGETFTPTDLWWTNGKSKTKTLLSSMHDKVISSVFASSKLYTNNLQSDLVYVHLWRRHEAFTVPDGRISFFCLVSVKQSQHEVHIITRTNTRINTLVFAKIILQHLNGHHARCHTSLLLFSLAFFGTLPYRREQSQR